ncbi:cytochrome b5 domain-containing protein 1 isoform X1 [Bacillus rossius redtenbacheri]
MEVNETYFTHGEVVVHNTPDDLWVSMLGKVLNLTDLVKEFEATDAVRPIIANAGKDISHWFDQDTEELRHHVHPVTGVRVPYLPHGPIPHVGPEVATSSWRPVALPWWRDPRYVVGRLTERSRPLRVLNMLINQQCTVVVCKEDKLSRVLERYLPVNSHAASYTWKSVHGRVLDMDKTLEENGIPDERDAFLEIGLKETEYIPLVMLYFNDDLTEL